MPLKLVETAIRPTVVRLRYADDDDQSRAMEWIDFQFIAASLKHPKTDAVLGDLGPRFLLEIQGAALRRARDVIGAEIQRLRDQLDHLAPC
jgi:hypothetical protein